MSTHGVYVIRLGEVRKHPQADSLGLVEIEGYTCVIRTEDFLTGDLAIYVEPDYILPGNEHPFSNLWSYLPVDERRIKVRKFRGIYSQGLLMKLGALKDEVSEGDNVMERLGIVRYDPYANIQSVDGERPIDALAHLSAYDMENFRGGTKATGRKWKDLFVPGEPVIVTEKINGESARYTYQEGRMWVGSRTEWKRPLNESVEPGIVTVEPATGKMGGDLNLKAYDRKPSVFWMALKCNPWIETWCRANEGKILYGEVFHFTKKMHYGLPQGFTAFLAFDIYLGARKWLDAKDLFDGNYAQPNFAVVTCVPVVYRGPFDPAKIEALAEADSVLSLENGTQKPHYAEGVVIKPEVERIDPELGRVLLKIVGNRYLEKA